MDVTSLIETMSIIGFRGNSEVQTPVKTNSKLKIYIL